MQNDPNSDRIAEFNLYSVTGDEDTFVGDSQTARAIEELRLHVDAEFAEIRQHMTHYLSHDRLYPTPGCPFCEVRRAA